MKDRRIASRQRSFLQGRIYFNNRRSSINCLVRDYSDTGAKLKFSESVTVPEAMELYIPNKDEFRRVRVQWRVGDEMGIAFGEQDEGAPADPASADLVARMQKLEGEIVQLKRICNELRAEIRKQHGEVA
jgi:hypothetical protein